MIWNITLHIFVDITSHFPLNFWRCTIFLDPYILDKGGWYAKTQEKTFLVCLTHYTNKFQIRLESGTLFIYK